LAGLATALGLFLAVSWGGLWIVLPPLGRAIGLVLFGLLLLAAAWPLIRLRLPSVHDGLRRLDRESGEKHRPASAITDAIAGNREDPVAQALWRAHVERALMSARRFKAGWPSPRLALRDPVALRALVLLLVVATFFAATGERVKRITAAFDWEGVVAPANFRIDAWVTPPDYTGRPPIMLSGLRPGQSAQEQAAAQDQERAPISVPTGSQLVVRATDDVGVDVTTTGGLVSATANSKAAPVPNGTKEHRLVIKGDGTAALRAAGNNLVWTFKAIPDRAPKIALLKAPEPQASGSLRLDYKIDDDYGAVDAKAIFRPADQEKSKSSGKPAHPLYGPPDFALALPEGRARAGAARTIHDLTAHPWAGLKVVMSLVAHDAAGNEGRSGPHEFRLPQRLFVKPLPRALIEQRRILALDANSKPLVLIALNALTIAPDKFTPDAGVYLGLRSIYYDLKGARTDDQLRDVVARLWDMAVHLEDGNISDTERALRQAQEALRQALDRGASDQELKKLMENLRAAMDKYLQALAEQMRKNPERLARPLDRNTRILRQQDIQNMLNQLDQMARSGNKEAARRLLDQLQSMMENLQMARPNQGDQDDNDMMSALDELGDMIRKQQQLRDTTFKQGQESRRNGQPNQRGQQFGDLRQDQQALRDRLKKLLEQLRQHGLGQQQQGKGQQGQQGQRGGNEMGQLGDAGKAMGEAEGDLGQGDADGAVDSQGRALDAMRKGARGMAQAMEQRGYGAGPGQQAGPNGRERADNDTDPLGRPRRHHGFNDDVTVKVPGEIDAQRARRILEELRKRYGESNRPQLELDYIERLLQGF
jgi:uncharacterized protein (TIGR02302 family)